MDSLSSRPFRFPRLSRRQFLAECAVAVGFPLMAKAAPPQNPGLAGQVGITTSSLFRQNAGRATDRNFEHWDIPRILRDELDMKVIDLSTGTLGSSRERKRLDRMRQAAADAGCVITNLKVNATHLGVKVLDLPFDHADRSIRRAAIDEYKQWIRAAQRLGARWLRPFPSEKRPEWSILIDSYRELAEFGAEHGVTIVVENATWIRSDSQAIPNLVRTLMGKIAAAPDTGSWDPSIRFDALAAAFPHAVTCDFKVADLTPDFEHRAYDLRRCFATGWKAGFRGPWCIEHGNQNTGRLFREWRWIKAQIENWTNEMARQPDLP
jgi:hypothetical protein